MKKQRHPSLQSAVDIDQLNLPLSLSASTGPVKEPDRILAIDALRGVAALGILAMNIQYFSQVSAAYLNPMLIGFHSRADSWIWLVNHELFDQKMMTIFSLLYGAGIVLLTSRIETKGCNSTPIFLRRSLWLMLFGLIHAYLLWSGDILFSYAICGLVTYPFRKWQWKRLLVLGFLAVSVSSVVYLLYVSSMISWPADKVEALERELWHPTQQQIADQVAAYRGGWLDQMPERIAEAKLLEIQGLLYLTLWRSGGLMLIGMALYKLGVLTGSLSVSTYRRLGILGLALGIPIISYGVFRDFAEHWNMKYALFIGTQFNYWGSLGVALTWICAVMLVCKTPSLKPFAGHIALVGRMAFSNYILETLICTTIFYGHGFAMFGRYDRKQGVAVVLCTWIALYFFSQVWMRYFFLGPLEWLWRSLTYWKRQPFRRVMAGVR
jgi:uncharacterized protein